MTKDRDARHENRRGRLNMVLKDDLVNVNTVRGMVREHEIRGVVQKDEGADVNALRGMVEVDWPSMPYEPQTPHCTAITKKGNACKAAPVAGTTLCVGHTRQSESQGHSG